MSFFNTCCSASNLRVYNSFPTPVSDKLYDVGLKVQAANTGSNSFYFFRPYKTADFSKVICDKTYFFLWSTDHDSSNGGLFLGKGNKLDLSDFEYVGLLQITGVQIETPYLIEKDGTLMIYCHTHTSDTGNNGKQQTKLFTYSGVANELHLISTWTDLGRPLSIVGDENHTGYFNPYERETDIIGVHIAKAGLPQPIKSSISTDGGYTYSRNETIDAITGVETNYFAQLQDGRYFDFNGSQYWIGHLHPQNGYASADLFAIEKKLIIAKVTNNRFSSITQLDQIHSELILRSMPYIDLNKNKAHIYFTKNKTDLYYGIFDLNNLFNY
jgi:hypothetical protein